MKIYKNSIRQSKKRVKNLRQAGKQITKLLNDYYWDCYDFERAVINKLDLRYY